jgi:uncharacterized protein (TIGR01319 family)
MEGARLLADGTEKRAGLGELLVVDIGGATTDVHSVAAGKPAREGVLQHGLPEPRVKRTVEGDLGMRHNAAAIVESLGRARIAERSGLPDATIDRLLAAFAADVERLPASPEELAFDESLAWAAVRMAVERHAGTSSIVQTVQGPVIVQTGKDLSALATVIGTGGPLFNCLQAAKRLAADGISAEVLNASTIKPIDEETLVRSAAKTKHVVTVEDHSVSGGLGGAVAEVLGEALPTPLRRLGTRTFGESGDLKGLYAKHGLDPDGITLSVRKFLSR